MSYNVMIGYDIYDCFTVEHFRLRQRMTLTIKIYCSRLYMLLQFNKITILVVFFLIFNNEILFQKISSLTFLFVFSFI
jgi:hypothetical protein